MWPDEILSYNSTSQSVFFLLYHSDLPVITFLIYYAMAHFAF